MTHAIAKSVRACLWIISGCILVLWARSNLHSDSYRWIETSDSETALAQTRSEFYSGSGGISFSREQFATSEPARLSRARFRARQRANVFNSGYSTTDEPHYPARAGSPDTMFDGLGVYHLSEQRQSRGFQIEEFRLTTPYWLLLLLSAGYPVTHYVMKIIRQQRAERIALGMCPRCECDVRGKEKCPSCGKGIAPAAPATSPNRIAA